MFAIIISPLIDFLHSLSKQVPLPIFAFFGAMIEEVIAPIPSPLVMTLSGSLLSEYRSNLWSALILISIIGAVGKTIGSYFIYLLADKGEDIIVGKLGKFMGVSQGEIEQIGKKLSHGWKDNLILFLLRAIPIMPTAPVSIACGVLKVKLMPYLIASFMGTIVRNIFYLYLGFTSINALESLNQGIDNWEKLGYLIILLTIAVIFLFIYLQRKKSNPLSLIKNK